MTREELLAYFQRCKALQQRMNAGLHGKSSLFQKTLRAALDAEQLERLDQSRMDARRRQYAARIRQVLASFEDRVKLTVEQRKQLLALLESKTEGPATGGALLTLTRGKRAAFDSDEARFTRSLAAIREEEWKPIFQEADWPAVRRLLAVHRQRANAVRVQAK